LDTEQQSSLDALRRTAHNPPSTRPLRHADATLYIDSPSVLQCQTWNFYSRFLSQYTQPLLY
jgi:hypothetical protein